MAPDSPRLSRPTSHRGRRGPSRPSELKQANVQELIALLRAHNPCSRADLVRLSGLSAPTVSSAVEYLERKHLVRRLGLGASNGGRPPDMLEFNADFGYIAGVDLGGTSIRLALADLNGRIIARWNVSTHGHRTPDKIVTLIQQGLRRLLTQNKLPHSRLLALGVGAPGITDVRAGVVLSAPHLSNWQKAFRTLFFSRSVQALEPASTSTTTSTTAPTGRPARWATCWFREHRCRRSQWISRERSRTRSAARPSNKPGGRCVCLHARVQTLISRQQRFSNWPKLETRALTSCWNLRRRHWRMPYPTSRCY